MPEPEKGDVMAQPKHLPEELKQPEEQRQLLRSLNSAISEGRLSPVFPEIPEKDRRAAGLSTTMVWRDE